MWRVVLVLYCWNRVSDTCFHCYYMTYYLLLHYQLCSHTLIYYLAIDCFSRRSFLNLTAEYWLGYYYYYIEWFAAADKMLLEECKHMDVIITTALSPGRKAPTLIKKAMVEAMPSGGVTVDLAAPAGGNVETTVPGK